MEFEVIERGPGDLRQSLTPADVQAACRCAFGPDVAVMSVRELGGGEFNSVYCIALAGRAPVVLRVAPPPGRARAWHEQDLMRHEHTIRPYFAPIASLLPVTLAIDFTHQVLDRDYLFQSFMPGERWKDIASQLTPAEEERLWRQLAQVARSIHDVQGETFGHPHPGRQFSTWSATILDWMRRSLADAQRAGLDASILRELQELYDFTQAHADLVDEVTVPRLLHGDLWPMNILIERGVAGVHISAVLDSDRVSWGDPLADWTFYLLPRRASARVQAIFWDEYGRPDTTRGARFRAHVYEGLHLGNVLSEVRRRGRTDLEPEVQMELHATLDRMRGMSG
ncbi:MAG TPA: aminoglycoside phosphotransferase family protein [Ktedonobacterales bacterium]|nr:aminoglycoside phosphotransferase family protein [Ktedonobacterales bacterium]